MGAFNPVFLTVAEGADMSAVFDVVLSFITGFLGCVVGVIQYVVGSPWLVLLLFAVPLGFVIFGWVKGMIKIKGKG